MSIESTEVTRNAHPHLVGEEVGTTFRAVGSFIGFGSSDSCTDGKWYDAPKVRARMYSAEEKRAAVEKLEQERQQAMAAAMGVRDICVEGQEQGDHQHGLMGMYELVEGKEVNGRGMWEMVGGWEYFMNYAMNKTWLISGRETMEAGGEGVYMKVASTALTPDQATETWQVVNEDVDDWVDAPKVKTRCV
jgi:hypothetical protein